MLEKESQYLAGVKIGIVLTRFPLYNSDVIPQIRKLKELGAEIIQYSPILLIKLITASIKLMI